MKRFHIAIALAGLGVAAGGVLASTTTNTPGSACVAASGSLVRSVDGQTANLTTSAATAVCPIDRQIAPNLSTKVAATVWVVDENPSTNVCCTLHSKNPGGGDVAGAQVCSSGFSASYQTIALAQITDGTTFSHYFISCTVPGTSSGIPSKVMTYRSIED